MKAKLFFVIFSVLFLSLVGFNNFSNKTAFKCMIEMKNYTGEAAYIVISLLDSQSNYIETLFVQGNDDEWFSEIPSWWQFYGKYRPNIDAISGATVGSGKRAVNTINIPNEVFDKGYKLRFETAVEDDAYYEQDVEIELQSVSELNQKIEGTGYIKYIRLLSQ